MTHQTKVVPRMLSALARCRSFAYVGPSACNCLLQSFRLKLLPLSPLQLRKHLKIFLFSGPRTPLEVAADLNAAILLFVYVRPTLLRSFTFSLTCGFITVHFITVKNLTCLILPKIMSSQVFPFTWSFYTDSLHNQSPHFSLLFPIIIAHLKLIFKK